MDHGQQAALQTRTGSCAPMVAPERCKHSKRRQDRLAGMSNSSPRIRKLMPLWCDVVVKANMKMIQNSNLLAKSGS
eukprot:1150012-Pelagomonas_calceolata.AAC.1